MNPVILEISKDAQENGSATFVGEGVNKRLVIDLQLIKYIQDNLEM